MEIKSATFIKGITGTDPILQERKPHVAFIGRSNVGKSSLINSLCHQKSLVKVSSQPGKTKRINFFLINESHYFVDLPGYGYASVSQKEAEKLRQWIVWYLLTDEVRDKKVVLVLDCKVGVTEFDREVLELIAKNKISYTIVANKIDTIKTSQQKEYIERIKQQVPDSRSTEIIIYSSKNNTGRDALTKRLFAQ